MADIYAVRSYSLIMKHQIQALVSQAIATLAKDKEVTLPTHFQINIETARDKAHGDYATNAAMVLAKVGLVCFFEGTPIPVARNILGLDFSLGGLGNSVE